MNRRGPTVLIGVIALWSGLGAVAELGGGALGTLWPRWPLAFVAAAVWGLNLLLLAYAVAPGWSLSSVPFLTVSFGLVVTIAGSANYWAATQLFPNYRVDIERAAYFVAVCTAVSLLGMILFSRVLRSLRLVRGPVLEWDWPRLRILTYALFVVSLLGTLVSLQRIGYVPILTGDPTSARVDFPSIGGVWYRLSMLGGVVAILAGTLASARQAPMSMYCVGLASLASVGVYGPRFFVALPLGVVTLLWDRLRNPIPLRRIAAAVAVVVPIIAFAGYWRQRDPSASLLGPIGLVAYFAFVEFRELAWALDYFGSGGRLLLGGTIGSAIVPLMPSPIWRVFGIDKAAIYAHGSAQVLADAMGADTGQRIGAYGEFFINFGWTGAILGALLYGGLVAYLDDRFRAVHASHVRGVFVAIVITSTVFAQIGQLDLFTSTLTGFGYPLALIAVLASRRAA